MNNLNSYIDSTILHPFCTKDQIIKLCNDGLLHNFYAVCVPPTFVQTAFNILENSKIKICTVIGYPNGYHHTQIKAEEIKKASSDGTHEVDIVVNISSIKSNDWAAVSNDLETLSRIAQLKNITTKLIIEMAYLSHEEIIQICEIAVLKEFNYIKTSSGTTGKDVTLDDVHLLKSILPNEVKIKASGGIKSNEFAQALIKSGADRIGTSSALTIYKNE